MLHVLIVKHRLAILALDLGLVSAAAQAALDHGVAGAVKLFLVLLVVLDVDHGGAHGDVVRLLTEAEALVGDLLEDLPVRKADRASQDRWWLTFVSNERPCPQS